MIIAIVIGEGSGTHSSTLAWKIPWLEEPGGLQSMGTEESDLTEWLHFPFSLSCIGEGNGDPLQCSCLKNPRDGGAWWAAVYGVAQSRTWLKRLSSSNRNNDDKKRQSSSVFVAVQKWCLGPGKCGPAAGELGDASSPSSPVLSPGCSHGSNFRGHCENRNQDCFVPWVLRPSLS